MSFRQDAVLCRCNPPALAVLRTTQKAGPNQGRKFYSCSNNSARCNFFQWADAGTSPSPTISSLDSTSSPPSRIFKTHLPPKSVASRNQLNNPNSKTLVKNLRCEIHNQDLVRKQVQSETANKGKWYYKCPVEFNCTFVWDDNQDIVSSSSNSTAQKYMISNSNGWANDIYFELVSKHYGQDRNLEEEEEKEYNAKDNGVDKEHETIAFKSGEDYSDDAQLLVRLPQTKAPTNILESVLLKIEGGEKSMVSFFMTNFINYFIEGYREWCFPWQKRQEVQDALLKVKNLPVNIHLVPDFVSNLILSYDPVPLDDERDSKLFDR